MRYAAVRLAIVVLLVLPLFPRTASAQDRPFMQSPGGWLGADKPKHFAAASAATTLSTVVLEVAGFETSTALVIGVSATMAAGLAKEWLDYRDGRFADPKDVVWNAAGAAAGALLVRLIGGRRPTRAALPVAAPSADDMMATAPALAGH